MNIHTLRFETKETSPKSPQIPVLEAWNSFRAFFLGVGQGPCFLLWKISEKPTCGKLKIFGIWKSKECWKTTMSVDGKWGLHLAAQRVTGLKGYPTISHVKGCNPITQLSSRQTNLHWMAQMMSWKVNISDDFSLDGGVVLGIILLANSRREEGQHCWWWPVELRPLAVIRNSQFFSLGTALCFSLAFSKRINLGLYSLWNIYTKDTLI